MSQEDSGVSDGSLPHNTKDANATSVDAGENAANAARKFKEEELGFAEGKTTVGQALEKLKGMGLQNVKVHAGRGDAPDMISADGLDFMLLFGIFGYTGKMDLSDYLAAGIRPKNYTVEVAKSGVVFITAEEFLLAFPSGKPRQGVLSCKWIENALMTSQHDMSVVSRENGGFSSPRFFKNIEGDEIILHAKTASGGDWQSAYSFDADSGKIKARVKWDDVKTALQD